MLGYETILKAGYTNVKYQDGFLNLIKRQENGGENYDKKENNLYSKH